jgi:GxxExxY protein
MKQSKKEYPHSDITSDIIASAIEVHKSLGPGLLENIYEEAMAHEFSLRNIKYARQHAVQLKYKGKDVGDHRLDFLVEDAVVVELKAVESLVKIYEAQLLTYLNATGKKVGLLINFNVILLKEGIKRMVL